MNRKPFTTEELEALKKLVPAEQFSKDYLYTALRFARKQDVTGFMSDYPEGEQADEDHVPLFVAAPALLAEVERLRTALLEVDKLTAWTVRHYDDGADVVIKGGEARLLIANALNTAA